MRRIAPLLSLLLLLDASAAGAVIKIYQVDEFNGDIGTAAGEISASSTLTTQPGFAQGEAFGQIYRPASTDYPIAILGLEFVLAAPPNDALASSDATIEIWTSTAAGPDPGTGTPIFSINTADIYNPVTQLPGQPLVGDTAMVIDFDWTDPTLHPPVITEGNIWVMLRYAEPAVDLAAQWGTTDCVQNLPLSCGCQSIGSLFDGATTLQSNVLQIISSGSCSGTASAWYFTETVAVVGDLILRVRADVNEAGCIPDCDGKNCGSDGCGGLCGDCFQGELCVTGACTPQGTGSSCTLNSDCQNGTYCADDGTCTFDCRVPLDCDSGETCDPVGRCVAPETTPDGGCGCGATTPVAGLLAALLLVRRRRRRA